MNKLINLIVLESGKIIRVSVRAFGVVKNLFGWKSSEKVRVTIFWES